MTSQWFGDYEIVRRLRVGGMATLYLARRHGVAGFARLVALKMVHPHLVEQSSFVEMFVDEARICSRISHPNVVHVEDFGVIDDVHYLAMEYLDGCSVNELLVLLQREGRRLEPELAARIIMQIASGLHAAHETRDDDGQLLDVIHRDISPSNILLSSDGNAKLIDFGIAKARNRLAETEAGISIKGKYKYVAPEQATRSTVDRRCDLFSLGVVFWELLVGQPLFTEDTHVALFNRLARTDVHAPSVLNPMVPPVLDSIVLAMLEHDPANRPQTAAELQRRIAAAVPGAANRDPSELGSLIIEVRDKRAARDAAGEPAGRDNHVSFSPTPRSNRLASGRHRTEVETSSAPSVREPGSTGSIPPPAVPARWSGRRLQLGVAALLGIGVAVGMLVNRGGPPEPSAGSGRELVIAPGPSRLVRPAEARAIAAPSKPPAVATPSDRAPAAAAPSEIAPPARASASSIAAAPTRAPASSIAAAPTRAPAAPPSGPARRELGHAPGKPRLAPRAASGTAMALPPGPARPAPSAPALPFSSAPFDDEANDPAEPRSPVVEKTPIVPEFDN
jgi:serine/threonine-protein kinase